MVVFFLYSALPLNPLSVFLAKCAVPGEAFRDFDLIGPPDSYVCWALRVVKRGSGRGEYGLYDGFIWEIEYAGTSIVIVIQNWIHTAAATCQKRILFLDGVHGH